MQKQTKNYFVRLFVDFSFGLHDPQRPKKKKVKYFFCLLWQKVFLLLQFFLSLFHILDFEKFWTFFGQIFGLNLLKRFQKFSIFLPGVQIAPNWPSVVRKTDEVHTFSYLIKIQIEVHKNFTHLPFIT